MSILIDQRTGPAPDNTDDPVKGLGWALQLSLGGVLADLIIAGENDGELRVGVGTDDPAKLFTVAGDILTEAIQITTGAADGYLLTSDAEGNATWAVGGDANHFHSQIKAPTGTDVFTIDDSGNLSNSTAAAGGAMHLSKTGPVTVILQNLDATANRNDTVIGAINYVAYLSDNTTPHQFAQIRGYADNVGTIATSSSRIVTSILVAGVAVDALTVESFVVDLSDAGSSVSIQTADHEVFARFWSKMKGLSLGACTNAQAGVLVLESDNSMENYDRIVTNVGWQGALSGTFLRRGATFDRQDVGELTDDGTMQLCNTDGYAGTGYIFSTNTGVYPQRVNSGNFTFDHTGVSFISAVGKIKASDTDANLCLYSHENALVLKNRLGATQVVGYSVKYFDVSEVIAPPVTDLTWTATAEDDNWLDVSMSHDGLEIFASPFYGIARESVDGGDNWTDVADFINTKYSTANAMSADGVYRLAGGAYPNDPKPLFLSVDSGENFTSTAITSGAITTVTFNATTRKIIRSSGSWVTNGFSAGMQIYVSGSSKSANNDVFKIQAVSATEITLIAGSTLTTDTTAGESITITAMIERWKGAAICDDGSTMVACATGGERGIVAVSADDGATWTTKLYGDWRDCCISADGTIMYACSYTGSVAKSTNSGATWAYLTIKKQPYLSIACSDDGDDLLLGTGDGYLHRSDDAGVSWATLSSWTGRWTGVAIAADGSVCIACTSGGTVIFSVDSGANWTQQDLPPYAWVSVALDETGATSVLVAREPDNKIYIGA